MARPLPICSGLPASSSLLLQIQQEARSAFSHLSCEQLDFCSFHLGQEVTTIAMLTWLGNLYIRSPQGRATPVIPCACNPGLRTGTSRPSSGGLLLSLPPMAPLVPPELSSGLWLTIAQCLARGLCALPLGTAAFFPHQPPYLRNWRLAADWALLSWLRKGLAPSLMKEIVVFEVVYLCLFYLIWTLQIH